MHTLNKLRDFDVHVDSDSEDVIRACGDLDHVTAYKRSNSLIGDDVSVCDLIDRFISINQTDDDHICQLHVTSPFLDVDILKNAMSLVNRGYDSVVSCNEVQTRFWRKEQYGYCPVNHNPTRLEETQDLPTYYEENSGFYIINVDLFRKTKMRVGMNPYFYPLTFPINLDIDTEDDWNLVEKVIGQ
jgi:CMP-N-acetylneuraminic acid synthetase